MTARWPSVAVVVPVGDERALPESTLAALQAQDYPGRMYVIGVFEEPEPAAGLISEGDRPVLALPNWRTPGLAGARNTGILAAEAELVAFCDRHDRWAPGKLRAQVAVLASAPESELVTCAIEVEYDGRRTIRRAGSDRVGLAELARSRMAMLHSSTIVVRRGALLDPTRVGLLAEEAPGGHNEDWDLLLRAARCGPIAHLDEPLVQVRWPAAEHGPDYAARMRSLRWMLARHPELRTCREGAARVYGQLACWSAASGDRRAAWQWTKQAVLHNWHEPRAAIALAALSRAVTVESVLAALHRRGRGI